LSNDFICISSSSWNDIVSKFYQRISSKDYISNVVYKISIKMKISNNSKDYWIVDILVSILSIMKQ
jgi:hypothetical protein